METTPPLRAAPAEDARLDLLRHLGDPVRLGVLDRLAERGPSTVGELALYLGTSAPRLSNHLRRLHGAALVEVERTGRQAVYRLADERVIELLSALGAAVGSVPADRSPYEHRFVLARTCFDHLAGRLGVSLFERLTELNALRSAGGTNVELGPDAEKVLARLGVDSGAVHAGRRRFACTCPDATEQRPHLGGALGAVLAETLTDKGWISVRREHREVEVTTAGHAGLRTALRLETDITKEKGPRT
ncbi:ArsR/SmtB family transcription factor [Streptomyces sp. 3N207]|uniref:ArsR/SmtB family transcription factor n=1 Tax=Streptomyces sp. 3N207 TaxID=3457417 RepID=UPI003FD512A5